MARQTRLPSELLQSPPNAWDWAMLGVLGFLLAAGPLAFGGVEAGAELVILTGAACLSALSVLRIVFDPNIVLHRSWALAPVVAWLLLGVVQLAPLSPNVAQIVSPAPQAVRQGLLGEESVTGSASATIYPWATAHGLRLALVAATVFATSLWMARSPDLIKRLLAIAFAIGCLEAALSLAQLFTGATAYYWTIEGGRRLTSGSFVNYSNFSQFINLSIGCGAALWLVALHHKQSRHGKNEFGLSTPTDGSGLIAFGLVICALAVFASLSRNGAMSLLVATAIVGAALYAKGTLHSRGWLLAAVPLAVLFLLFCFGFDVVYARLATLSQERALDDRWQLTLNTLAAWRASPILGWGLGTHEMAFQRFDASGASSLAQHADNDYAQLLEETGVVGAAIVAWFFGVIALAAWRSMRSGRRSISAASFGLALGLIAVAIHSASDFGERLPANFCLLAVTCGLLVAIDRWERDSRKSAAGETVAARGSGWRRVLLASLAGVGLCGVWWWAINGAWAAYQGESWWATRLAYQKRLDQAEALKPELRSAEAEEKDAVDLLASGELAVEADPGNVDYEYGLNLDRWEAVSHLLAEGAPQADGAQTPPEALELVRQIADELANVRQVCAVYGPAYSLEGQLRFILGDPLGEGLIRTAMKLSPYDPATAFVAAQLAARRGDDEQARFLFARAVRLQPAYLSDATDVLIRDLGRPEWARALAGDDPWRVAEVARRCRLDERFVAEADRMDAESETLLRKRAKDEGASANDLGALAQVERGRGELEKAVEFYQQALALDYKQVEWRLQMAQTLTELGRLDEAEHHVRICLRLRPLHAGATQLLEQLSVRTNPKDAAAGRQ